MTVATCLAYAALVGVGELVEIIPLDEVSYEALRVKHCSDRPCPGEPLHAWRLARPRRFLRPIHWSGRQGLFTVPDELLL